MNFKEYVDIVKHDLYRYEKSRGLLGFIKGMLLYQGFQVVFTMRTCDFIRADRTRYLLLFPLFVMTYLMFRHCCVKYGMIFALRSNIGKGFYINHYGGMGVHPEAVIGCNFTIHQGVYIGYHGRGSKEGVPTIGDNVLMAMGAKAAGNVKIGSNVVIGANAFVNFDVPDNAVVIGNPGKIVSYSGSEGLIYNVLEESGKE